VDLNSIYFTYREAQIIRAALEMTRDNLPHLMIERFSLKKALNHYIIWLETEIHRQKEISEDRLFYSLVSLEDNFSEFALALEISEKILIKKSKDGRRSENTKYKYIEDASLVSKAREKMLSISRRGNSNYVYLFEEVKKHI